MARVLMVTGDGCTPDVEYATFRLREEQYEVVIASPRKKTLHVVFYQQEPGWDIHRERPWYPIDSDCTLDEVDPAGFDALMLPGGRAPLYLRNLPRCVDVVRHFVTSGKPIAANCRAPLILLEAGVTGRRLTGSNLIRPSVETAGCTFVDARDTSVVDGNILTVTGEPYHYVWVRDFLRLLGQRGCLPSQGGR